MLVIAHDDRLMFQVVLKFQQVFLMEQYLLQLVTPREIITVFLCARFHIDQNKKNYHQNNCKKKIEKTLLLALTFRLAD